MKKIESNCVVTNVRFNPDDGGGGGLNKSLWEGGEEVVNCQGRSRSELNYGGRWEGPWLTSCFSGFCVFCVRVCVCVRCRYFSVEGLVFDFCEFDSVGI